MRREEGGGGRREEGGRGKEGGSVRLKTFIDQLLSIFFKPIIVFSIHGSEKDLVTSILYDGLDGTAF